MSTKTVVITGAGSPRGIGRATAARFARDGWAVVAADLNGAAAEETAELVRQTYGVPALGYQVDVTDEDSMAALARAVEDSGLPPVVALLPIAGIPNTQTILESTLDDWNRCMNVNVTGGYLLVKAFVEGMIERREGRIVTMSSVTAQTGGGVFSKTLYAAAKAAVIGMTRGLARELAEHQITVNTIAPGAVDTDIRAGSTDAEKEKALSASVPLGRQATAEDTAAAFAFFAGDDGAYLTGVTLNLNGGTYFS